MTKRYIQHVVLNCGDYSLAEIASAHSVTFAQATEWAWEAWRDKAAEKAAKKEETTLVKVAKRIGACIL